MASAEDALTPRKSLVVVVDLCPLKGDRRTWVGSRVEIGEMQPWP